MTPDEYEAQENAESIRQIPLAQFPCGPARREAIRRALAGQDIYAYQPVSNDWVIWDRQRDPAAEARFPPRAWAAHYGLALDDAPDPDDGSGGGDAA